MKNDGYGSGASEKLKSSQDSVMPGMTDNMSGVKAVAGAAKTMMGEPMHESEPMVMKKGVKHLKAHSDGGIHSVMK